MDGTRFRGRDFSEMCSSSKSAYTKPRSVAMSKQSVCGLFFKDGEAMEMDHIIPKEWGGSDSQYNRQLLHRHCHDVKTARDKTLAA